MLANFQQEVKVGNDRKSSKSLARQGGSTNTQFLRTIVYKLFKGLEQLGDGKYHCEKF